MSREEPCDPTVSATVYPANPAPLTQLSRNEIETLCLKAARGAGMPWGVAEEAGFAAGWLAANGIDGATALLTHLVAFTDGRFPVPSLEIRDRFWHSTQGAALCPIALGSALDDHAALESGPAHAPITTAAVSQPVLIVPFLARAAQVTGSDLALMWDGGAAVISADGALDNQTMRKLSGVASADLTLEPRHESKLLASSAPPAIPALSASTLRGLNALALRTTVPASDASRRGAGATTSDND
ncbi:DUF3726 domain-containing protein [Phaeovulum sp.]|uniref:DUF3726 domain-containing protein n=1 Tax=Phaeovulum sp. TaxID=2934796 RepID=UPI0039E58BB8